MNLSKIEIQGFKSFADKTEIIFDTNITGIVGPNGCGKSNVVEAVRWVLGEQKSSALRISKNTDLIFGGTKTGRKSQSYCEASIFLDNSKHIYPIDFEELVVTRKLDRSGESSSYINGQRCNLKDIINLFRDTGVGREGYSIIGQGKIDSIVGYKPEARREIFEEAAGISKHKDKKNSSENKLSHTRDNMSRLNDIMLELEQNLGPLKSEAEQAIEVKKTRKELKNEEIHLFLFQSENSDFTRNQTQTKLKEITKTYESEIEELSKLNEKYNNTLKLISDLDTSSSSLHDQILALTVEAQKALGRSENLLLTLAYKKESRDKNNSEYLSNQAIMKSRAKDIVDKIAVKQQIDDELQALNDKNKAMSSEFSVLNQSVDSQEKEIELSKQLMLDRFSASAEIDKNRAKYEVEYNLLKQNLQESKLLLADKKKLLSDFKTQKESLISQIEKISNENKLKLSEKSEAELNFDSIKKELNDAEIKRSDLITERSNLQFKLSTIRENIESYSSYDSAVQNLMESAKQDKNISSQIIGTLAEIISVPKEYMTAIEIALGNSIQNIVTPDERSASILIDLLKRNNFGRATFLPVSSVKPYPLQKEYEACLSERGILGCASDLIRYERRFSGIVSSFLGRTIIAEDKEVGLLVAKKYNYAFRIVTLEGEAFLPSGAISGGSSRVKSSRILSQETEAQEVDKKLNKCIKEISLNSNLIEELKEEKEKFLLALNVCSARLAQIEKELIELGGKLTSVCEREDTISSEENKTLSFIEQTSKRIEDLYNMLSSSDKSFSAANQEKISADDFLSEAKDKYFKDKEKRDNLSKELTDMYVKIKSLETNGEKTEQDIFDYRVEYKSLEKKQIELEVEIKVLDSDIAKIQKDMDIDQFPEEERKKLKSAQADLEMIDKKKKNLNQELTDIDDKRAIKNTQINVINEKKIREENNLEKINIEIENMSSRIYETYGLNIDECREYWIGEGLGEISQNINVEKSLDKILRLRRKIERMGPINELAEDRYNSESIRYEEMKRQFDDLSKAEQDLVKIISDLTKEMEQRFTENFKKISENFKITYKDLFGGGTGHLSLEKGVSPLTAGIYIDSQPPGKDLKSIELLSGGEKTLTAIAILFAINKLTPMPFSILDEIDASLDETNARLFAQYLSKFSKDTEFIVITHRKPTMSLCDVLYGVTMQEKGVSKIVKVKLEEAEKHVKEEA
ncbi:MAG: Chromosome partition protein Smc [Firmicutes bacterium ADurb.Bin080]|nr:chromosome segregation protein SMC [Clostridiales bacterium]OQC12679.1 MAG: Chromosome partition protein Smc [Firmicutes bacterium ADurb.Bin080]